MLQIQGNGAFVPIDGRKIVGERAGVGLPRRLFSVGLPVPRIVLPYLRRQPMDLLTNDAIWRRGHLERPGHDQPLVQCPLLSRHPLRSRQESGCRMDPTRQRQLTRGRWQRHVGERTASTLEKSNTLIPCKGPFAPSPATAALAKDRRRQARRTGRKAGVRPTVQTGCIMGGLCRWTGRPHRSHNHLYVRTLAANGRMVDDACPLRM